MGKNESELHYLQMIIDFYVDHEDTGIAALLMRISESLERMRACA
ncbi:MAG: hypothetical protein RBT82_09330 [Desulfomonilia bacterium]|jgi:hypothetical protein|nr:hypothetical protein [Desulfomonilia bacterium]